ncbi:MAG: divalent-cation tolerance protein CutA [Planctomycetales bacterium]|nr:divalent-cation tolerance protein CutA [Planctomycetales bacterium]
MSPRLLQIHVTFPSSADAERVAMALVELRLAACAQVGGPIQSVYRWQGAVEHAAEWTLLIKTTASHFEAVVEAVRERHGYDCPEIVATEIIDASDDYRRWLVAQVADIDSPSA